MLHLSRALILLIILGIDWASGYAIAGYCITHGVSPYGYALWQSFAPMLLMLLIQILRQDLSYKKADMRYAFLCGLFGIVIPNLLIYLIIQYVESGILTVIANSSPLLIYPLALLFKTEKFKLSRAMWVGVGMVGIYLIVAPASLILNFNNIYLYLTLLIPLSYAFSAVYIVKFIPKNSSSNILTYSLWMLLSSTLFLAPLCFIKHGFYPLKIHDLNSYLILIEVLLSSLGYCLLFIILKMVGAVYYSLVNAITALCGLTYGYFLYHQIFSLFTIFAAGLIILAIIGLSCTQLNAQYKT